MFEMDVDTALDFYQRCIDRKAETLDEKTAILVEMAKEGRMKSVIETQRTPDQVAEDLSKNFGNVLYVSPKKDLSND